ncbi:MAG: HD domain-containing protein, partial [Alphaproteobacteria bacterium]|nr:HD domain-containing protein [Alphaproteobacteria bacterium]
VLLMGTDMFLSFLSWREPEQIMKLATLAVFFRGEKGEQTKIEAQKLSLESLGARVELVENPVTAISSTDLRRMLVFGCADPFLMPGVDDYIRERGLYGTGKDRKNLPMEELEAEVIAGLLHDTLEDTPTTEKELRQSFGNRITDLVMEASEPDKSLSWEERKEHTLQTLQQVTDMDLLMLVCADKLSNISSIASDLGLYGSDIWGRFNRGYEQQKWYYCGLAKIFAKHTDKSDIFEKYIKITNEIFCE